MTLAALNLEPHPVYPLPTPQELVEKPRESKLMLATRHRRIAEMESDPLQLGWEPPIWKVNDALLGFNFVNKRRDPEEWQKREDWNRAMREYLGFPKPVSVLLINGGNRGGKSEYAAKRVVARLLMQDESKAWCLHSTSDMSIQYQQKLLYKYLPNQITHSTVRSKTEYISYKTATGFSTGAGSSGFILPNKSDCYFRYYSADIKTIEGGELDIIWPDELVPREWLETLDLRVATREGKIIVTFTPVEGYTPTVKLFQDGAVTAHASTAFLDPLDTDPADLARALGLRSDANLAHTGKFLPRSIPEDCNAWLQGQTGQPPVTDGRKFNTVPRVMRCTTGRRPDGTYSRAVTFIHSSDNPFGNPQNVFNMAYGKRRAELLMRFYGLAEKTVAARFPKFDESIHTIAPESIPTHGTRYMLLDPSTARNWFMLWALVTSDATYIYREWPGPYEVPGVGFMGSWAEVDGKRPDGRKGPAQDSLGWGILRYKQEIARLENWADYHPHPETLDDVYHWDEHRRGNNATGTPPEAIIDRIIDSRGADAPTVKDYQATTLHSDLEENGLYFTLSKVTRKSGQGEIAEGVTLINTALDILDDQPVSYANRPKLFISTDCHNTIFALQHWTGDDGNKGACKEPIDLLRYLFATGCCHADETQLTCTGGGYA